MNKYIKRILITLSMLTILATTYFLGIIKGFVMGTDCLPELACVKRNFSAINALEIDKYTIDDAPFYYGKIGLLGYILSEKEWVK